MANKKQPARPTEVKVLTVTYEVQWLSEDDWYKHRCPEDAVGLTERDKALILMRADPVSDEDALRSTLLHEVLHCCTQASRLDRYLKEVEDPEEFFIAQVSPIFMSILNDNPGMVAYLLNVGKPNQSTSD